jgi:ankyrin repeat protein
MIALAIGPPLRVAVVAAPSYLSDHSAPIQPASLHRLPRPVSLVVRARRPCGDGQARPGKSINRYGGTALIPAAERGHVDTERTLIAAGIDMDHVNNLGVRFHSSVATKSDYMNLLE